jgi:tetratricopeptide (TPR) repeat protein
VYRVHGQRGHRQRILESVVAPRTVIGERFVLGEQAGEGGMGSVHRGWDPTTGAPVAIKLLRQLGPKEIARFQREARVLAELRHPHIVRYLAHGHTPGVGPFLAMEWLEGEDLCDRLARQPLTVGELPRLFTGVCEALAHAHERGIVHRDLKPGNIFLPGGDLTRAKLIDFGVARLPGAANLTGAAAIGTPAYMAPEQARGRSDVGTPADLFSLGCVLFECLTGAPPFAGPQVMAVLAKILIEEPRRVGELVGDVPALLDDLVARLLSKDPALRPQGAAAVLERLREVAASGPDERAAPRLAAPALTAAEQRVISVVLVAAGAVDEAGAAALAPVVEGHGGRLDRLLDGALVVTLAGVAPATDMAARAARCALAMRERLSGRPMAIGTGRAEVSARLPVGEVIDRTTALVAATAGSSVALDEMTADLLDVRFVVARLADGLRLDGERDWAEGARTLLGKPTPFVGRDREVTALEAIVEGAIEEPAARAVLLTGAPGSGKSRLRAELLRRMYERRLPIEVLIGRGDPMSAGSPFGLLAQAVRRLCGVGAGDPAGEQRRKLRDRLARWLPEDDVGRVSEFLGEMVGVPFPADESVALRAARQDPLLMGDQIRTAWTDWLAAECRGGPVLLVLEDLHWGDLATATLVDAALHAVRDQPLIVVALGRPEVQRLFPGLWSERAVTEMRLPELGRRACERLVREALGAAVAEGTLERVLARAEGNPFYLEELIRAVAEGKEEAIPETVVAMVQARLDALEPEARRIMRAAAVFGQRFWPAAVQALLGEGEGPAISEWLDTLAERELIERLRVPAPLEYRFHHAIVREAAYAMLTPPDRQLGHRLAGQWLESTGQGEAGVLAEHFDRGQEPARAAGWYRRAAEQALQGNDLLGALRWAERGLAMAVGGEVAGGLRLVQAEAHNWRARFADAEPCAAEAIQRLPPGGAPFYRAVAELVAARGGLGQYGRVAAWSKRLLRSTPDRQAVGAAIVSGARSVIELLAAGRYDLATPLLELVQARATGPTGPEVQAWVHRMGAMRALGGGDLGAALNLMELARARFEQAGDVRNACGQRCQIGDLLAGSGLCERAAEVLEEVLSSASRLGLPVVAAAAKHSLAMAWARLGRLKEAAALQTEALSTFAAQGERRMEGAAGSYLAQILLLAGDLGEAERAARNALEALKVAPPLRPEALAVLSSALLARSRTQEAVTTAADAVALMQALGGVERGESLVWLSQVEALRAAGRDEEARQAARIGTRSIWTRAATIQDSALRERFLRDVPPNARLIALAAEPARAPPGP